MNDTVGSPPFEPMIGASVQDVEARIEDIRRVQESAPNEWRALRLREYWNGASSVVVVKPERISPTDVVVTANGMPQDYKGGLGVIAVLIRVEASHLVVTYNAGAATVHMTLPIQAL